LLLALIFAIWNLAVAVERWTVSLKEVQDEIVEIKKVISNRWAYVMEKAAWKEFERENEGIQIPDVEAIRQDFDGIFP
jgi:hypothetical protein